MATHFEIFDKLRELGKSLDNSARTLPKFTEDDEEVTNKARATITLRSMSADAKKLNDDVNRTINESKKGMSFEQFLALCETQTRKIKDNIENLQDHLSKYGYKKPTDKLPVVPPLEDNSTETTSDSSEQSSPESTKHNKENLKPVSENEESVQPTSEPEESVFNFEKPASQMVEVLPVVETEEFDPLRTPVPPVLTTTKLYQYPVDIPGDVAQNSPQSTLQYGDFEPCPPATRTPLIQYTKSIIDKQYTADDTDYSTELPVPPQTRTPLIKHYGQKPVVTPEEVQHNMNQSFLDDFPTPPVFTTPGFQRYGSKRNGDMEETLSLPEPPTPPDVTSVRLLRPEDMHACGTSNQEIISNVPLSSINTNITKILPFINEPEYQSLPLFLQNQFSLDQVNHLIEMTDNFLNTKSTDDRIFVSDDELLPVLKLGARTKAFILLMIKLNYFTLISNGVYEVIQ